MNPMLQHRFRLPHIFRKNKVQRHQCAWTLMIAVHHEMMPVHNLRLVVCLRSSKRLGLKMSLPAVPFVAQTEEVSLFGAKKVEATAFGGARGIKKAEAEMKVKTQLLFSLHTQSLVFDPQPWPEPGM